MQTSTAQTILLVEDNYDDAEIIEFNLGTFKQTGLLFEHCDSIAKAICRLEKDDVCIVLLDLSLPDSSGIDTALKILQTAPLVPLVVLTGTEDEDLAIQALQHGAQDYLIKDLLDLPNLCRSINYAIARQNSVEAHAKLAAIVESSDDAIIGKTLTGIITSWNKGAERLFGYSADEMAGRDFGLISPDDSKEEVAVALETLRSGEVVRKETVCVNKNGRKLNIYQTISPVKSNGKVTSAAAINHDITEFKRAQKELKDTEQRLALALKSAEVGVWDLDLLKNTVWRSLRHDEIFGHNALLPEWNFETFLTYVHPQDREYAIEVFDRGINEGNFRMECRIYRASDSALRWISSQGETFRDENGKPIRMMGAVVDITERKEREEQDRLVAVIKEREDFMATLTHDMKNPIIAANRLLEMFVSGNLGELTEQQQEIMQCMFDSNVGVLKLIANLTDVYRLEKNVNSLVLSDVNLSLLLSSFANRMKHFAELRHVKIIAEIPSAPQEVQADRVQIERVFQNLLDNALKFSPSGGTVRIVMSMTEHHHIIEVEDNGPGIAADELPLLFKRFSQGRAGKRYTGGSGLGLYLCKQIVEAHGGTIDCQSQVAQYTKFRVCLPAGHSAGLAGAQENHHE